MMTYAVLEGHWSLLPDILLKISMDDDHDRVFFHHNGEICVAALIPRSQWTDREIRLSCIEVLDYHAR